MTPSAAFYVELARRAQVELRKKHLTERKLIAYFRAARRARL